MISGSFAERDLHCRASFPPCMCMYGAYIRWRRYNDALQVSFSKRAIIYRTLLQIIRWPLATLGSSHRICVCVCVCWFACAHVLTCGDVVCACVSVGLFLCVCLCMSMTVSVSVSVFVSVSAFGVRVRVCVCMDACESLSGCIFVCTIWAKRLTNPNLDAKQLS